MSGKPGNISQRRTSEELIYAILGYLGENDEPVRLTDIAVEIGSNTKLVQRWLNIINDVQLKPKIIFEDKRGPRINLSQHRGGFLKDYSLGIYIINPNKLLTKLMKKWIKKTEIKQSSIFNGSWNITEIESDAALKVLDPSNIDIFQKSNLLEKPILLLNSITNFEISRRNAFFFVMGWLSASEKNGTFSRNVYSLDLLSLLSNNLIAGLYREIEIEYLPELFSLFTTQVGQHHANTQFEKTDLVDFFQIVATLIDTRVNEDKEQLTKSAFWCTLTNNEQSRLSINKIGRLLIAKINYCTLNPDSLFDFPPDRDNIEEYHIWELLTQIELEVQDIDSRKVKDCLYYLNNNKNDTNNTIYNFISQIMDLESRTTKLTDDTVPLFYKMLNHLAPILPSINYPSTWNWNDLGKLLAYYNQLNQHEHPIIKILVARKMTAYVAKKKINIIFDYQLIKDYLSMNINYFSNVSVKNILTWHLYSGNLFRSGELIQRLHSNLYPLDDELRRLVIISLTCNLDMGLLKRYITSIPVVHSTKKAPKNYQDVDKITKTLLDILEFHYDQSSSTNGLDTRILIKLISTEISEFQINVLELIYKYFTESNHKLTTGLSSNSYQTIGLFTNIINYPNSAKLVNLDYKTLLSDIVELNIDYETDNLIIYTYMICIAYLLSVRKQSNSYIRDNLRSKRRNLETFLGNLTISSYGAFAKLLLVIIRNLEETLDETSLLRSTFPSLMINIKINKLLQFLFIRYLFRSNVI